MARHRFGLNINARSYSREQIMQVGRRVKASAHLVMHDPGIAQSLYEQAGGNLIAISRSDWPDDTTAIEIDSLVRRWQERARTAPNVYHYFPNEPVVEGVAGLKRFLKTMVAFMRQLRAGKVKAVIGNFAWANILFLEDVESGVWDDFIREASAWTNEGWGYVGGHDYTWGVIPFGAAKRNPYDMLTPALVQKDKWPSVGEVNDKYKDNWLLLRWLMLSKRAEFLGVPMFKMVITEAPLDRMPNLEVDVEIGPGVRRRGVITEFDLTHGRTRGPISQKQLFPFWYPQWTPEQTMIEFVRWIDLVYPEYVEGFTFFGMNKDWPDYNYYDWPGYMEAIAVYEKEPNMIDFSQETPVEVKPAGDFQVKFRDAATVNSNVYGFIPKDVWTDMIWLSANEDVSEGANTFRPVRWAGIVGWVAANLLETRPEQDAVGVVVSETLIDDINSAYAVAADHLLSLGELVQVLNDAKR